MAPTLHIFPGSRCFVCTPTTALDKAQTLPIPLLARQIFKLDLVSA